MCSCAGNLFQPSVRSIHNWWEMSRLCHALYLWDESRVENTAMDAVSKSWGLSVPVYTYKTRH